MTPPLVHLRAVSRVFSTEEVDTAALSDVSLDLHAAQYVVVKGPSGCGKSTLLSLIGLLEKPTSGVIEVAGKDVSTLSATHLSWLRGTCLGFVFQAFHLIPYLSVRQNIALPLRFHRTLTAEQRKHRVEEVAERVGITQRLEQYPAQLSGGQQQRVAIARALAGKPRLLLADEPTGNLDRATGDQIMELISAEHRAGTGVVLVSHDARYQALGQRTIQMHDGRIVDDTLAGER